jgi:ParB-like chromosome segregation protein Spo0J
VRGAHQLREIARARNVARVQAGRIEEARVVHAELGGHFVHGSDECLRAARIRAGERGGGAVLGGHQRDQQQLVARERDAGAQARARALLQVDVFTRQRDLRLQVEAALEHDDGRHQLGDGGDRSDLVAVLVDHHFARRGVDDQRGVGAQRDFLRLAGLSEADGQREDENEGEDGDDSLERMKRSLHCGKFP